MPYEPTQLKKRRLPTLNFAKKALEKAEDNDPKRRDVRDLHAILQRLPEVDPRLMGMMITFRDSILGLDWRIGLDQEDNITQELTARFKAAQIPENFDLFINTAFTGLTVVGPVRDFDQQGNTYYPFQEHDLTDITPDDDSPTGAGFIRANGVEAVVTPIDNPNNFIVDRYNPLKGIKKNYTGGLLRSVLWYVLIKNITNQLRVRWMERYAEPDRDAEWNPGASDDDIQAAIDWAQNPGDNASSAHSDKVKLKFLEAARNPSKEAFQAAIDECNTEISILILGQTASTEGTPGKLGAEDERSEVRLDRKDSALRRLTRLINDQFLEYEYQEITGLSNPLPDEYKFKFVKESEVDFETNARTARELNAMGADLDADDLYEKTGFKRPENTPEIIRGKQPMPQGF